MKAAELEAHPEFPYLTWDLKPNKKAKLAVAAKRGGPLNIAYEVHGNGPRKMIVSVYDELRTFGLLGLRGFWSMPEIITHRLGQRCGRRKSKCRKTMLTLDLLEDVTRM